MTDERDYDVNRPLRDVIGTLLKLVLPAEQRDLIPRLTDMVSACKGVVEHRGKLWANSPKAKATSSRRASALSLARLSAPADLWRQDKRCIDRA